MGTLEVIRCLIGGTRHQLRRDQDLVLRYCVKVQRTEIEPSTEGRKSMEHEVIIAYELQEGDVFSFGDKLYVWNGDTYDEDTLWVTEQGTMVPYALDIHEEVELCT